MAKTLNINYQFFAKPLLIIALWQLFSSKFLLHFYLSSPKEVAVLLISGLTGGVLLKHVVTTGTEVAIGLAIGIPVGISLGFLFWYSSVGRSLIQPLVLFLQAVPVFLFAPLVVLWFGIGLSMKIVVVATAVCTTVLAQIYEGTKTIKPTEYFVLETFGASRLKILRYFMVPATFSWVRVGLLSSVQAAILGAVIAEFISSNSGLGYFLIKQAALYNAAGVFAGALLLAGLSLCFSLVIKYTILYFR